MPSVRVTDTHVVLPLSVRGVVTVSFDGGYVWSFRAARDGRVARDGARFDRHVAWPDALRRRLSGTTRVCLQQDGTSLFDAPVAFGRGSTPLQLRDRHGHRLAVDSAGHLTRVFAETNADARRLVVEAAARILDDLRALHHDAHLSYGCLLGAVRDGRMIGHDSDADVAYLSEHCTPADVIGESYEMERALRRRGWRVIRMSGADLKVLVPLDDGRTVHVDVFGAFHVGDTFYQLGGRSGRLPREALTPASAVRLEDFELPAPADPEAVLAFLYGPEWRRPDPSFQNVDPPEGVRRLDGWLRGFRTDVVGWNELYRDRRTEVPWRASSFARWTDALLDAGAGIADLGSGNGRDAAWFARCGRPVRAYDFAGAAIRQTRRRLAAASLGASEVGTLALNDRRSVLVAGAELARTELPVNLYARGLVGCLDEEALEHLWLLSSMTLRRGGALLLEFPATGTNAPSEPISLHRRVDPDGVVAGIRARGGRVDHVEVGPGLDFFDRPDPRVARVVARWNSVEQA